MGERKAVKKRRCRKCGQVYEMTAAQIKAHAEGCDGSH